ncbi:YcxB family protein [Streptomyces sp. SS]|uniref:YcxB family protein n=1 Tax=Streptomyces sp. SS TaxID=260742 RepID=UPI000FFCA2CB|nr:YcxB family protein [Streptomyces sp. SS]
MMELVYTPTREDLADAVRVQMRHGSFRRLRWLLPSVAVLAFLVVVLMLTGPGGAEPGRVALMASLGLLAAVLGPVLPRLVARQMFPMVERQGEHRASVDEQGVRWVTRESEVVGRWQLMARYAETSTQFVLLSADKGGVGMAALPKRALADAGDVDRLREVLDRNATRM